MVFLHFGCLCYVFEAFFVTFDKKAILSPSHEETKVEYIENGAALRDFARKTNRKEKIGMNENLMTFLGILIPFLGTGLGAAAVFLFKHTSAPLAKKCFSGFAAGVMVAASVWSLLIPAIERAASPWPAALGLLGGVLLFLPTERLLLTSASKSGEAGMRRLFLAVTLHNLPEGMAVGVVFAGARAAGEREGLWAALVLAIGIALQNLPEGAILSMPLSAVGAGRGRAFLVGLASGVVEPIGAVLALILTGLVTPILPWVLSAAAGAMLYVVTKELIPSLVGEGEEAGLLCFALGFCVMMVLDVLLG